MTRTIFQDFKTSEDLVTGGVRLDFGDYWIKIAQAGSGNPKYVAAMEEITREYQTQLRTKTLNGKQSLDIMKQAYSQAIVLDWGGPGMVDANGKPLKFSPKNAYQMFVDLPDFFQMVREHAEDFTNFRQQQNGEDAKNSDTSSTGT